MQNVVGKGLRCARTGTSRNPGNVCGKAAGTSPWVEYSLPYCGRTTTRVGDDNEARGAGTYTTAVGAARGTRATTTATIVAASTTRRCDGDVAAGSTTTATTSTSAAVAVVPA